MFDAIYWNNDSVKDDIEGGVGITTNADILVGADVHNYVRLITETSGNTALQLRVDPISGSFETVLEYDSLLSTTIDQIIAEGTLFVRATNSMADTINNAIIPQKALADAGGLNLIAYEGRQHLAAASWGPFAANQSNTALTDLFSDVNAAPEMGDLYALFFDAWQTAGGGLFAHYADYGGTSIYGSCGTIAYLGEQHEAGTVTPKFDALQALNTTAPWWTADARDPGAFLQGITEIGTAGDDTLVGTVEEDLLIGLDGNDSLTGGPGDDSLSGGAGTNIVDAGDDLILLASTADTIDGGAGFDMVKLAGGLTALDLAALNATNVEALDLRDAAHSDLTLSASDVFAFSPTFSLTVFV